MSLPKPYHEEPAVTIFHGDCREIVPHLCKFDLLLTDPPYGIGESSKKANSRGRGSKLTRGRIYLKDYGDFNWDSNPIDPWAMRLMIDRARFQIIFGGNYYELPPCKGPLIWDKENTGDFADGEMAWNNLGCALRIKRHRWNGMLRKGNERRDHPTQKPLEVISWAMQLAGDVETILDPYAGSGTTGRAAKDLGKRAVLIEREERYCEIAAQRLAQEVLPL